MSNDISVIEESLFRCEELDVDERLMIEKASRLLKEFPDHALIEIWNASIHNLRRRVEAYSIEMFLSSVNGLGGRKATYKKDGDSLSERWAGVEDEALVTVAGQLGIIDKKSQKALEMINWMRNHASAAHENAKTVTAEDVVYLAGLVKVNLFDTEMPNPGSSPVSLIEPIKDHVLNENAVNAMKEQINNYSSANINVLFGFGRDVIIAGEEPQYTNMLQLFPTIWEKANDESRSNMGNLLSVNLSDRLNGKVEQDDAWERIYEMLVTVNGVKYIPEYIRASIYKHLSEDLKKAKNTTYGWNNEEKAAKALAQIGNAVPASVFDEVYQEILSVWCGNYWGRSNAHIILNDFIFAIPTKTKFQIVKLFRDNERVNEELSESRPNKCAIDLLNKLKADFTLETQISETDSVIDKIMGLTNKD